MGRVTEVTSKTQWCERGDIEVRVIRSLAEVEALRSAWTSWPSHRDSDIDFYLMIVQSYPEVVRPHVVVLYRDGTPEAILVGRLEHKRFNFKVGYLSLFRPWARCLTFVYGAIHGSASVSNVERLVRAVTVSLKANEADMALFEFVPLDNPLYQLVLNVPGILSRDALPASQLHDAMAIPARIDEVYRRMSHGRRKHTKASVKKLEAGSAGKVRISCYQHESEFGTLFRDAEEIAKKTYQRGLRAGFADTPDVRMRLQLAARKGWLRAYLLYLGERPCAFWIGMLYGETFVSEYMGYDPEFRKLSPGMVLIMRVLERLCNGADGQVKELDFGLGHAEYKAVLCDRNWLEAAICIFSPTPKGLIVKVMRTGSRLLETVAKRILASTDLFRSLKRAWRDRIAGRERGYPGGEERLAECASGAKTATRTADIA